AADAYVCRDMRNLDGLGQYDAICCCCDSFNYLLDRQEILSFFQEVWKHLTPGGWFFFDTHSTDRLDEFREEWNETGTFPDGCDYQWSIRSEDDWIYQDFAFYRDGQTIQEHHIQRVYDPQWLADCFTDLASEMHIVTDFHTEGIQPGEKIFYQIKRRKI
ncbi:MAG: class I SAM-dependent methyltransferase, partial [Erysipelotrichaceae bacterium]|nr:class I SAM-dependent methyltransferase [Erysipelotrichaceae bacterium]